MIDKVRKCLSCEKDFASYGRRNRICEKCRPNVIRNDRRAHDYPDQTWSFAKLIINNRDTYKW
jgi:hypothetical protein